MEILIRASVLIDALSGRIGRLIYWMILISVVVSSGNAVVRYIFDTSSNAWLELQWYLFSAVFLLGAGYTLLHNQHVRIDIIAGRLSPRGRAWIDLLGGIFFLMPMAIVILTLSWPAFIESFVRHEYSSDAGGLLRWPARLLVPVGFFLLVLQGLSEIIKRVAFLRGLIPDPSEKVRDPYIEEAQGTQP